MLQCFSVMKYSGLVYFSIVQWVGVEGILLGHITVYNINIYKIKIILKNFCKIVRLSRRRRGGTPRGLMLRCFNALKCEWGHFYTLAG